MNDLTRLGAVSAIGLALGLVGATPALADTAPAPTAVISQACRGEDLRVGYTLGNKDGTGPVTFILTLGPGIEDVVEVPAGEDGFYELAVGPGVTLETSVTVDSETLVASVITNDVCEVTTEPLPTETTRPTTAAPKPAAKPKPSVTRTAPARASAPAAPAAPRTPAATASVPQASAVPVLAETGAEHWWYGGIGAGLVALGTILIVGSRGDRDRP